MREYLLQLKTQAIELWQKMTRVQKIVLIGSAALLFGTLVLLARGATKPDYGALFTQLDDQQAGQIVEKLKEKKILYKLSGSGSEGGTTISVPSKDITQTRLELAGEGLPTGGVVGFEDFDNTKFGETDTDRRARYLRALQGELTRTIEGMAEVEKAQAKEMLLNSLERYILKYLLAKCSDEQVDVLEKMAQEDKSLDEILMYIRDNIDINGVFLREALESFDKTLKETFNQQK